MNKIVALKLVLGTEVRKTTQNPKNLAELYKVLNSLYGTSDFRCTYIDDENDMITIRTDTELLDAYQVTREAGMPCLKIVLTEGAGSTRTSFAQERSIPADQSSIEKVSEAESEDIKLLLSGDEEAQASKKTFLKRGQGLPCHRQKLSSPPREKSPQLDDEEQKNEPEKKQFLHRGKGLACHRMKLSTPKEPSPKLQYEDKWHPSQPAEFLKRGEGLPCLRSNLGKSRDSSPKEEVPPQEEQKSGEVVYIRKMKCGKPNRSEKKHKRKTLMKEMIRKVIRQELDSTPALTDRSEATNETTTTTNTTSATVHNRVECDNCGMNPIVGIRYKCYISPDFDFCENCEASVPHPYPFIKIRDSETFTNPHNIRPQDRVVEMDIDVADLPNLLSNGLDAIKARIGEVYPPQAEVVNGEIYMAKEALFRNTERRMQWTIKNTGVVPIPAGTSIKLSLAKYDWDLQYETIALGEILPGKTALLGMNFTVPNLKNKYHYSFMFKLVTPSGQEFGPELLMEFNTMGGDFMDLDEEVKQEILERHDKQFEIPEEYKEKVETLKELGFSVTDAQVKIVQAKGDVELAINMLLN